MVEIVGKHWKRNDAGAWEEYGSLPAGHKRFQIQATETANGTRTFGNYDLKEAEEKVAAFMQKNAPNYSHYGILPVQGGEPMSEETKAKLKADRKAKKATERAENAANTAAQPGAEAVPAEGVAPAPKPKKEKKAKEPKAPKPPKPPKEPKPKKEKPPKAEKPKLPDWTPIEVPKSAEGKRLSREAVFATETWQAAFKLYWEQGRGEKTCPNGHDLTQQENVGVAALLWDGVARCQPCWKKCNDEYLAGLKAKKAPAAAA